MSVFVFSVFLIFFRSDFGMEFKRIKNFEMIFFRIKEGQGVFGLSQVGFGEFISFYYVIRGEAAVCKFVVILVVFDLGFASIYF